MKIVRREKLMSHKLDPLLLFCKQKAKFRSWKTLIGPEKGHGKSWNFKMLKGYEPWMTVLYVTRRHCLGLSSMCTTECNAMQKCRFLEIRAASLHVLSFCVEI